MRLLLLRKSQIGLFGPPAAPSRAARHASRAASIPSADSSQRDLFDAPAADTVAPAPQPALLPPPPSSDPSPAGGTAHPPGAGWERVPRSLKSGWRKPRTDGHGYRYWYPGDGPNGREAPHPQEHPSIRAEHAWKQPEPPPPTPAPAPPPQPDPEPAPAPEPEPATPKGTDSPPSTPAEIAQAAQSLTTIGPSAKAFYADFPPGTVIRFKGERRRYVVAAITGYVLADGRDGGARLSGAALSGSQKGCHLDLSSGDAFKIERDPDPLVHFSGDEEGYLRRNYDSQRFYQSQNVKTGKGIGRAPDPLADRAYAHAVHAQPEASRAALEVASHRLAQSLHTHTPAADHTADDHGRLNTLLERLAQHKDAHKAPRGRRDKLHAIAVADAILARPEHYSDTARALALARVDHTDPYGGRVGADLAALPPREVPAPEPSAERSPAPAPPAGAEGLTLGHVTPAADADARLAALQHARAVLGRADASAADLAAALRHLPANGKKADELRPRLQERLAAVGGAPPDHASLPADHPQAGSVAPPRPAPAQEASPTGLLPRPPVAPGEKRLATPEDIAAVLEQARRAKKYGTRGLVHAARLLRQKGLTVPSGAVMNAPEAPPPGAEATAPPDPAALAKRYREKGQKLEADGLKILSVDRIANTRRRAEHAAHAVRNGEALRDRGRRFQAFAGAIERGEHAPTHFDAAMLQDDARNTADRAHVTHTRGDDLNGTTTHAYAEVLDPDPYLKANEMDKHRAVLAWNRAIHKHHHPDADSMSIRSSTRRIPPTPQAAADLAAASKKLKAAGIPERDVQTPHQNIRRMLSIGYRTAPDRAAVARRFGTWLNASEPRQAAPAPVAVERRPLGEDLDTRLARARSSAERTKYARRFDHSDIPGYFPTPPEVVEKMIEHARLKAGDSVLEPSAGQGNIADRLPADVQIHTAEVNPRLRQTLEAKGYQPHPDGLKLEGQHDVVLQNPPFEQGADIDHVRHHFERNLKPGGRMVTIMSESPFFREDAKARAFREWLSEHQHHTEKIDPQLWKLSGTGVNARMVVIHKPHAMSKARLPAPPRVVG